MFANYEKEIAVATKAVERAARLCRAVQAGIRPETLEKRDRSPVTVADFGSQAVVCRTIDEAFPSDPIIAEEDGHMLREAGNDAVVDLVARHVRDVIPDAAKGSILQWIDRGGSRGVHDRFWTLDPIDGTKGFLRSDQYAIAVALIEQGAVRVAALACPNLNDKPLGSTGVVFIASRSQGTVVKPLFEVGNSRTVVVSDVELESEARFCESVESGHSSHDDAAAVAKALGIRSDSIRLDSQAKYAIVARGDAEIYMRLPTRADYVEKIWDHAAGLLVVEEAGGRVTDVDGHPLDFTHGGRLEKNSGVIATNARLHDRVLDALRSVGVA